MTRRTAPRATRCRRCRTRGAAARAVAAPWPSGGARRTPRPAAGPLEANGPAAPASAFELRPGLHPLRVVHALLLAVAAVGDRRLPELDRVEVRRRRTAVVLRRRAGGELVHDRARLRVRRRLTEVDRLLCLHLRRRDPL